MPTFDRAYYQRYYHNPSTRAASPAYAKRQAAFIAAYARYIDLEVTSILDMGCGVGRVLKNLGKHFPSAQTEGVEYSSYLCERYGWKQGSVVDVKTRPADLVVCNDVLAYLGPADCRKAIKNLARHTRGALFLGVITEEDQAILDEGRTDPEQHLRPLAWYRKHLKPHFISVGGGLHLAKQADVPMWALDVLAD